MNQYLQKINSLGQSIWYDNLSRAVLENGELKGLIDSGVSGLTSNPSIFNKAIAGSADYDQAIAAYSAKGLGVEAVMQELMVEDIRAAAELLTPQYETSNAKDGYASIEVSPLLAKDTAATVKEGVQLWEQIGKPNIMIKVPATAEGIPAISELLANGINVNVTLIFSVAVYEKVIQAYLIGVEQFKERGGDLSRLASVASFFVSRVDAVCEKEFDSLLEAGSVEESARERFLGKVGIANSLLAYELYRKTFEGEGFKGLKEAGAQVQRPLWASTGTKNPTFRKTLYVEELIGPDTVNTVPPATLEAILDGLPCENRLLNGYDEARSVIATVKEFGIPFDDLLVQLENDGVESFSKSFVELRESLESKQNALG